MAGCAGRGCPEPVSDIALARTEDSRLFVALLRCQNGTESPTAQTTERAMSLDVLRFPRRDGEALSASTLPIESQDALIPLEGAQELLANPDVVGASQQRVPVDLVLINLRHGTESVGSFIGSLPKPGMATQGIFGAEVPIVEYQERFARERCGTSAIACQQEERNSQEDQNSLGSGFSMPSLTRWGPGLIGTTMGGLALGLILVIGGLRLLGVLLRRRSNDDQSG